MCSSTASTMPDALPFCGYVAVRLATFVFDFVERRQAGIRETPTPGTSCCCYENATVCLVGVLTLHPTVRSQLSARRIIQFGSSRSR